MSFYQQPFQNRHFYPWGNKHPKRKMNDNVDIEICRQSGATHKKISNKLHLNGLTPLPKTCYKICNAIYTSPPIAIRKIRNQYPEKLTVKYATATYTTRQKRLRMVDSLTRSTAFFRQPIGSDLHFERNQELSAMILRKLFVFRHFPSSDNIYWREQGQMIKVRTDFVNWQMLAK